ncbi:MAG: patatin-like protein [Acidimicrobiales bacterium]|nr:patatin-like protein [Acidimicrobiales bacterium]
MAPAGAVLDPALRRELRLATSFSGGVSLAVWMGGVAAELQALVRASASDGAVYRCLLDVTGTEPVIDVLAGTSAGGINGAALALAFVNGGDVRRLRDVWLQHGDLTKLLRDPADADPPSLLRGDEHLGAELVRGLTAVLGSPPSSRSSSPAVAPVAWAEQLRLTVSTTILSPRTVRLTDVLGRGVSTDVHLGLMRFRHGDLVPSAGLPRDVVVRRLAVAARASASYPIGFEPASVPVGPPPLTDEWHAGVELGRIADWDHSTWALDGGLLLNEPLDPVIADVIDQPADREVRRIVVQITPNPTFVDDDPTVRPPAPSLVDVMGTTLNLPRDRNLADELRRIVDHNAKVQTYREQQRELRARIDSITDGEVDVARRALGRQLAVDVLTDPSGTVAVAHRPSLTVADDAATDPVERIAEAWMAMTPGWSPATVNHAAQLGLSLVRTQWTQAVQPPDGVEGLVRAEPLPADGLPAIRAELTTVIAMANWLAAVEHRAVLGAIETPTPGAGLALDAEVLRGRLDTMITGEATFAEAMALLTDRLLAAIVSVDQTLADGDTLLRLATVVAGSGGTHAAQPIELLQLTANMPSVIASDGTLVRSCVPVDATLRCATDKLRGFELMHFSAFAKQSWRANDWMWGRLDAAAHLCRLLLDVPRLRAVHGDAGWRPALLDALAELDADGGLPYLVDAEIMTCDDDATELPCTVRWLTWLCQVAILGEELPVVASSIDADAEAGSALPSAATFAEQVGARSRLSIDEVAVVLPAYRVHQESLLDELGTPRGMANATRLAAIGVAAGASQRSGAPTVVRALLASLRGASVVVAGVAELWRRWRRRRSQP